MVQIVTGKMNSFKTTKMIELFNQLGGDGFVSVKKMVGSEVHSYHIMQLSTGESALFIGKENNIPEDFEIESQIGPYLVSKQTLLLIESKLRSMIKAKVEPIFLDEVGLLECNGLCFASILKELLTSNLELYLSIRSDLVDLVVDTFHINNYNIIT
jgi:nucleoside-triphosphatase THEP1